MEPSAEHVRLKRDSSDTSPKGARPSSRLIALTLALGAGLFGVLFSSWTVSADKVLGGDPSPEPGPELAMDRALTNGLIDLLRRYRLGGAFGAVRGGRAVARGALGSADPSRGIPNTARTRFNLGSVSKQFTGYLLLESVRSGKMRLDDQVSRYLPALESSPIGGATVRQLMQMTSGLPFLPPVHKFLRVQLDRHIWTEREVLELIGSLKLDFPPGQRFGYSNTGYILLALIVGKVEGMTWDRLVKTRIFQPFGMGDSTIEGVTSTGPEGLAVGLVPFTVPFLEVDRFVLMPRWNYSFIKGAGGIVSTVDDLLRWQQGLSARAKSDPAWAEEYFHGGTPGRGNYSYGWIASEGTLPDGRRIKLTSHDGEDPGYCSLVARFPEADAAFVLASNTDYCLRPGWMASFLAELQPRFFESAGGK